MTFSNHAPCKRTLGEFIVLLGLVGAAGCGGGSTGSTNNLSSGAGPVAAKVAGTVAVGTAPIAVAVDSTTNKIYVTDFGVTPQTAGVPGNQHCSPSSADITALDGATESTTSIGFSYAQDIPSTPFAAALNPADHTLSVLTKRYWTGWDNHGECGQTFPGMTYFDFETAPPLQGGYPFAFGNGINVNPSTGWIYIAGWLGGNSVAVHAGPSVVTVSVGTDPIGVAIDAARNKIYVANSGSNDISVIDGTTNAVVATIADPNAVAPAAVAVNPTTNTIYVANATSNNVSVIDGATGSVTATIPVGTSPSGLDVDPQTNFIYVANAGNSQTGDPGSITVINGAKNATSTLTDPKAVNPVAVAVNLVTNKIYVANSGSDNVTVINGAHD